MKVGIITIHDSPSYGASLQSYSLYKYIENKGHDVKIIDLHRPYQADYIKSKKYKLYEGGRIDAILKKIKILIYQTIRNPKKQTSNNTDLYSIGAKKKFLMFNSCIKKTRPYYGCDDLYENPPIFDVYITGSDQVWNPFQPYCIEPYFLTFAPKGKKKLSYAASLGIRRFPDDILPKVKEWLRQYDAISVREEQLRQYLVSVTGLKIEKVADPTFLLSTGHWKKLAVQPSYSKKYILLFTLNHNKSLLDYCLQLSKESGIELLSLRMKQPEYNTEAGYMAVTDAGPREFLGYIQNASMVITDSFHGTVFSFLMEAGNVFTYIANDNKRGIRIENLYKEFDCMSHILYGDLSRTYNQLAANKIDKSRVQMIIEKKREESAHFLNLYLGNGN